MKELRENASHAFISAPLNNHQKQTTVSELFPETITPDLLAKHNEAKNKAVILELFAAPVAFNRAYMRIAQSADCALLLSVAIETQEELGLAAINGWFNVDKRGWSYLTGLPESKCVYWLNKLKKMGIITAQNSPTHDEPQIQAQIKELAKKYRYKCELGFPRYRINFDKLSNAIADNTDEFRLN